MFVKKFTKLPPRLQHKVPVIENPAFKLHYKLTVTLLLAFNILICAREYFEHHIRCVSSEGVPAKVIESYCFFMATFTIVRHYNESLLQRGILPHPGVGPMSGDDQVLRHTYYQWVPFVLLIQACCFYIPQYVWKRHEGGRIKAIVNGLQYAEITPNRGPTYEKKIINIGKYIRGMLRSPISRQWSSWLVAMEVSNLVNVTIQIWLTDCLLSGHFIDLGPRVLQFSKWADISDPLETVFPKVTKCTFHKYGPSGSIQKHDALCVMALNVVFEKIYTILWFWLMFLFIVSSLAVIWREMSFFFFIYRRSQNCKEVIIRKVMSRKFNSYNVVGIVNGCEYGDWLFMHYLAKNMSGVVFQQLLVRLVEEFGTKMKGPTIKIIQMDEV